MPNRVGDLYLPGVVPYQRAWDWQKRLVAKYKEAVRQEPHYFRDQFILLEHPPVYTLGQGSDVRFVQFDMDVAEYEIYRTERGGEVTYHCPGQLVGYPILNLRAYQTDLHWYLRTLEEVLIRTLAEFGLRGDRVLGLTGVWVEGAKVAAIGIKASRWITMHGFALNVNPDLSGFGRIVPCGIEDKPVGCMAQFLSGVEVAAVREVLVAQFEQVFGLSFEERSPERLDALMNVL